MGFAAGITSKMGKRHVKLFMKSYLLILPVFVVSIGQEKHIG